MTARTALIVHPAPDETLLSALLRACEKVVVISAPGAVAKPLEPFPQVTQYLVTPGDDIVALAREIDRRSPVSVAPPVWEGGVEATASICSALGLPGNPPGAARAARDKHEAALCFARHGVPHPRTLLATASAEDRCRIEHLFAYPFIIKSPWSTNSQSVTLVRTREELGSGLAMLERLYSPDPGNRLFPLYAGRARQMPVIVQDYAEGTELNIDILLNAEAHLLLGAFEKYPMHGPTFEEVQSVYPTSLSIAQMEECTAVAAAAARALGAKIGAAHVELRLTTGGPVIIEVALRPGGFLTPQAISHLTGVHPVTALTRLLLTGTLPHVEASPGGMACLYGAVNCAAEGRIRSVTDEHLVRSAVPEIVAFNMLKRPGDLVVPLPRGSDYHIASFMLVGSRRDLLEDGARSIRRCVRVEID
jgi:biotin carboxylase